jgi:quinol monooxygenase YgiN
VYQIYAKFTIKSTHTNEALAILDELITKTREESGNISYQLFQSVDNPAVFTIFEQWKDRAAIDEHNASEHFNKALPALEPFHAAPPVIEIYKLVK